MNKQYVNSHITLDKHLLRLSTYIALFYLRKETARILACVTQTQIFNGCYNFIQYVRLKNQ